MIALEMRITACRFESKTGWSVEYVPTDAKSKSGWPWKFLVTITAPSGAQRMVYTDASPSQTGAAHLVNTSVDALGADATKLREVQRVDGVQ